MFQKAFTRGLREYLVVTQLLCWAHMKKNISSKQKVNEMLQDLDKIQLNQSEQVFIKTSQLFLEQ